MALIECSECGKQISDKAESCPNCGNPISQKQEYICCPKCKSKEIHAERKGFNVAKAVGGALLVGGFGILAGTIGSNDVVITCLKCANKFKAGDAFIDKGLSQTKELENAVIGYLKEGKNVDAIKTFMENTFPKPSMGEATKYIMELSKIHAIKIIK